MQVRAAVCMRCCCLVAPTYLCVFTVRVRLQRVASATVLQDVPSAVCILCTYEAISTPGCGRPTVLQCHGTHGMYAYCFMLPRISFLP
jgi:hypothetical protein